jgi:hypothetical protein
MPTNFSQTLTQQDIQGVVNYLLTSVKAGK